MSARITLSSLAPEAGIQGFVLWLQNLGGSACIPGSVYSWSECVRVAMSTRAHVCKTRHLSRKMLSMKRQGAERVPEQKWEITDPIPSHYFPLLASWG